MLLRGCRFFLVLSLALVVVACAPTPVKNNAEKIYWPKPPEAPRFVYETSLRKADDIKVLTTQDKIKAALTGISSPKKQALAKPYDIAARGGKVVVTDSVMRLALMFDVPRGKLYPFGKRDEGVLKKPMGVAMDNRQWIYIADVSDKLVKVFDPLGLFIRRLGEKDMFSRPVDVAVSPSGDRVYVVDSGGISSDKHQVTIFDGEGHWLKTFGRRGSAPGEFNLPVSATVAPDGTLYVLDAGNFRVQAFDREGVFLHTWGKVGRSLGDFARPRGIAVDRDGIIYVTDAAFRNIQVFNKSGQLLMPLGGAGLEDKPGQFVLPAGIAIDETNRLYIVDQLLNKIEIIRRLTDPEVKALSAEK
jgi:DNA-binding beta-propeller fold protein YncE